MPFSIIPLNVVDVLSPPAVNVLLVATEFVTVPAPAKDPTETLKPAIFNVAPLDTVVAEFDPKADAFPALNVPADTVVAPV
jgi:hypothetical protein